MASRLATTITPLGAPQADAQQTKDRLETP